MSRDPRKFIVETQDYPMDFICFYEEGTTVAASGYYNTLNFTHGLGFAPLCFGVFSADNSTNWEPMTGWGVPGADDYGQVYSDSSNVTAIITNESGISHTYRYRIWGIMPSTASKDVTIPPGSSAWRLNTLKNYSKLVSAGRVPATTGSTFTVATHDLGYVPEVMTWIELTSGRVVLFNLEYWGNYLPTATSVVRVNSTRVQAFIGADTGFSPKYIHYRIYGDQNG